VVCHRVQQTFRCQQAHCAPIGASGFCGAEQTVAIITPQCCVPADGSAHAVIEESTAEPVAEIIHAAPEAVATPTTERVFPTAPAVVERPAAAVPPVAAEKPVPAAAKPAPVAPASAEQPVAAPQPQFKSAREILEESAAREKAEKAAADAKRAEDVLAAEAEEAAKKPATEAEKPAEEPPMKREPAKEEPPAKEPAPAEPEEEPLPAKKPAEDLFDEPVEEKPAPKKPAKEKPDVEEENLFDEASDDDGAKAEPELMPVGDEAAAKPAKEASADELFGEPSASEPATEPATEEPAAEAEKKSEEPAEPAEAAEEKSEEPKTDDDPFAGVIRAPSEPVRRWIDNTGLHETIGRLVEVHPDRIRILKANGRHATVPFERLSHHDQAYVTATGERIAAEQRSRPALHDTAGL
ncbi:MAG: SHD1 domain-containing protein, partial [Planctomycetia bacterium]